MRTIVLLSSALANNLPDFDFVYVGITGRPLGYLLHHRGHTHTLPGALVLGALAFALAWPLARHAAPTRHEIRVLAAVSFLGPVLHIAMDASNTYGVHPFWPFYDGWMYADSIFIIEPLFWATAVPALFFAARTLAMRIGLALFLTASIGLAWALPFVPIYSATLLTLLTVGMMVATWRARPLARVVLAVTASAIVGIAFLTASLRARTILARAASATEAVVHAIALTPMPANPLCFDAWVVQTSGPTYAARRAMVAPLPGLVSAERCPIDTREHPTAPLSHDPSPTTAEIRWRSAFRAPRAELAELAYSSCVAAAFLRFSRVPYWTKAEGSYIVGDLRYDRNPGLDFADIPLGPPAIPDAKCPVAVPPWTPPRLDVLELSSP